MALASPWHERGISWSNVAGGRLPPLLHFAHTRRLANRGHMSSARGGAQLDQRHALPCTRALQRGRIKARRGTSCNRSNVGTSLPPVVGTPLKAEPFYHGRILRTFKGPVPPPGNSSAGSKVEERLPPVHLAFYRQPGNPVAKHAVLIVEDEL